MCSYDIITLTAAFKPEIVGSFPAPEAKRFVRIMLACLALGVVGIKDCAYGNVNFFHMFNQTYKVQ